MSEPVKGVKCTTCFSVIFSIDGLIQHLKENPVHRFYSFGGRNPIGALVIKILIESEEAE